MKKTSVLRRLGMLTGLGLCAIASPSQALPADAQIDLKLLVLAASSADPSAQAVQAILDRIGIPYDLVLYDQNAPQLPVLEEGNHAKYQGVIMAISSPQYMNPVTGGATAQMLARYQFKYNIRLASFYGWPDDTGCLTYAGYRDTSATALNATLTAAGKTAFPYLSAGASATNPLAIKGAWTYFASPAPTAPAGTVVTPLLQGVGTNGATYALGATCKFANAAPVAGDSLDREILALTFDNNAYLTHSTVLSYGIINWVTKGVFLGDRHVYMDPQVDDVGISADIFPYTLEPTGWYDVRTGTALGECPLGPTNASTGVTKCEYRINGTDLKQLSAWQTTKLQSNTANASAVRLSMVYNGSGFTTAYGGLGPYPNDTLTAQVRLDKAKYKWVNHTYDHEYLDAMPYADVLGWELTLNHTVQTKLALPNYSKTALVTPNISGLYSLDAMRAAADFGVTYLVSDTSRPTPPLGSPGCLVGAYSLPAPNAGKYNCVEPRIFEVPRYPTALFYNVSTPQEWTAEYNYFYGANGIDPTRWGVDLNYSQVLDKTSDTLLSYLLTYDLRPWMFHQTNLRAYNGTKSLLGDLIDATLVKYNKHYKNLPIRSPGLKQTGDLMKRRMVYNSSAVKGVLTPGQSIVLSATRADGQSVVIPVTGVSFGASKETYGGQSISSITLNPTNGYTATVTPAPAW